MARRTFTRRVRRAVYILAAVFVGGIYAADAYIEYQSRRRVFDSVDALPYRRVGVVLGTAPYARAGRKNDYYTAASKPPPTSTIGAKSTGSSPAAQTRAAITTNPAS